MQTLLPVIVTLAGMLHAPAAMAHVVNVFAWVEGETIHGEVYFRGGAVAQGALVEAFDPNGTKLAEATTDTEGQFSIPAAFHCDYRIVAQAGEGHAGEYTIEAAELPDELPPPAGADEAAQQPEATIPSADPGASTADTAKPSDAELREMIEAAVAKQVAPLRKDLNDTKKALRLRDLLGGIGYIVGIMGLWCFLQAIRRKGPGPR